ncbi:hypothetical protein L202_00803 [Cryptococcus amylolentus CBS 6039]|uniref:Ubinuclein middle domain-containing protein n=1 Tax=Cryptococcus amylolentus CBS 6039 TaxID=1295533 RepID=A0A1E3I8I8_9TREE|nr:hypothetical protein L202_00803 [Cryptococcus amylolentus CBS 6039]ODN84959.1 hypothetical protein L202_00803 [Cryptococcus amylolentus CBS 6039]
MSQPQQSPVQPPQTLLATPDKTPSTLVEVVAPVTTDQTIIGIDAGPVVNDEAGDKTPTNATPNTPPPQPTVTPAQVAPNSSADIDMALAEEVDQTPEIPAGETEDDGGDHEEEENDEGEIDVEGEDGEDGEDSEEEEDEEEEDEESDGDESEDLEESPEIIAIDGPNGPPRPLSLPPAIKAEPQSPGAQPTSEAPLTTTTTTPADTDAPIATAVEGEANVLVPKKKKRARLRTPDDDDDFAPPPPPMKTIRLERTMLPPGETLEWNILDEAREKGLCIAWGVGVLEDLPAGVKIPAVEVTGDVSLGVGMDVDGQGEGVTAPGAIFGGGEDDPEEIARRLEEKYGEKKKTKKKKRPTDYDLEDPFIDDADILIDAPTHYQRPKKEGFFVHAGQLELMEESPGKKRQANGKPKSAQNKSTQAKAKTTPGLGGGSEARPSLSSALVAQRKESQSGQLESTPVVRAEDQPPVDRIMFKNASREDQYLPPYTSLPEPVAQVLMALRLKSLQHDWDHTNRGKFPDHLKPELQKACQIAYQNDVFTGISTSNNPARRGDQSFVISLTSVFPYNLFTLTKLSVKLAYHDYLQWMQDCEDEGLRQFRSIVDKDSNEWIEKYEASRAEWEQEVAGWDAKHQHATQAREGSALSPPPPSSPQESPALPSTATPTNAPSSSVENKEKPDVRPAEPTKRFLWTGEMREVYWQLLENVMDMADIVKIGADWNIANHKQGKEWSEQSIRLRLYKRVVDCFPEGYSNNNVVSREMTKIKKRKEEAAKSKEAVKDETKDGAGGSGEAAA